MKLIITLALPLFLLLFSTNAQDAIFDGKPGEVILKGKIGNVHSPAQVWIYMGKEQWDTVQIKNGVFEYRKKTLLPAYGAILLRYTPYKKDDPESGSLFSNANYVSVFFDSGKMYINSPVDTLRNYAIITGSRLHDQHAALWKKEGEIVKEQRKIAQEFNSATPEQLQSDMFMASYALKNQRITKRMDSLIAAEIKAYPTSLVTMIGFYRYLRQATDSAAVKSMLPLFSETFLNSKEGQAITEAVKNFGKPQEPVITINQGEAAPDFGQNDRAGKLVKLSDFKGKYVLIDFWASWCVPCRKTNPALVKMFEKYKGEKFTILGVSLDENKDKWLEAINKDQLTWHHVSDLKGWDNAVAKLYGISGIPQNFLLDPNGKIIFKNLEIPALENELEKLLNN